MELREALDKYQTERDWNNGQIPEYVHVLANAARRRQVPQSDHKILPGQNFRVVHTPRPPEDFRPNIPASNFPVGTEVVMEHDNQTRFVVEENQRDGKYWTHKPWKQEL